MFGYKRDDFDVKVYNEQLKDFLPDVFVDAHTHVYPDYVMKSRVPDYWPDRVAKDCTIEDLNQTLKDMFPDKKVIPVIFGYPKADLKENNDYCQKVAAEYGYPSLYLTHYEMDASEIEENILKGGFKGMKPYFCNARVGVDPADAGIFDFFPHEQFAIADKHKLTVMLHISRKKRLKDELNISQLLEIEQKYPNANVIVAHVGRAYSVEDLGTAFDVLKNTERLLFDFTANTLSTAMERCIEAVGTKRIMFGSDLPITKMKMYRITENGVYINVVPRGLYGDVSGDIHMRETDEKDITNFMYEELLAFKRCAENLSLSKQDVKDIMCNNAARVFDIKL